MSFDKSKILNIISKVEQANELLLDHLFKVSNVNGKISVDKLDTEQVLAWDICWSKSQLIAAREAVEFAAGQSELEQGLASFYAADAVNEVCSRVATHCFRVGLTHESLERLIWNQEVGDFISTELNPSKYEKTAQLVENKKSTGNRGLTEDQTLIADTFKKFAEDEVMPRAEKVHRYDLLVPHEIMSGLREMGCFGLSIPQKFGGFQDDAKPDNMGMVIVTEELSRGSVGIAGSLITRPEILSKALLKGGTEEQKEKWLPLIASGERMVGIAVTEPNFGSDVAGMSVAAKKVDGGWVINGVKTWCTFAGYADTLLVLVRTNPDKTLGHKGLTIMIAEKPRFEGHEFSHDQSTGGHIEGKAIGTIGYRGMHSFEVSFQDYFVPDENVVGGEGGLGKGFYLQMEGFAGGRLQTAARAIGVMQAAFEKGLQYATERSVFAKTINNYQLTKYKLVRMAAILLATRQLTYHSARLMDDHKGMMEATLCKFYASKIAEWVTREAMQLHGGMGYAEEYAVSRYFVDARVFSIFEGAEDVLALRVISRNLLDERLKK